MAQPIEPTELQAEMWAARRKVRIALKLVRDANAALARLDEKTTALEARLAEYGIKLEVS